MSGSASGNVGTSKSSNQSTSGSTTQFPSRFLSEFQNIFGPGFGVNELIAALPKTSGLFGGQAGLFAPAPATAAPAPSPSGMGMGAPAATPGFTQQPMGGAVATPAPAGAPAGQPTGSPAPGPRLFTVGDIQQYGFGGDMSGYEIGRLIHRLPKDGGPFTLEQIQTAAKSIGGNKEQGRLQQALSNLEGISRLESQMPTDPRFGSPAPPVGVGAGLPGGVTGAVSNLGFGTVGPRAEEQTIRSLPTINAAQVNMEGMPGYQNAVFESQFRPVERELSRQGGLADQRLNAELAQRGLGGSGTGVGQLQRQRREVGQQIQFAAEDAANRASVQRFQMEYDQRLANAGFNQQAQMENARNVLLGDTAKADNYLKTIGLNAETAEREKASLLNLLGLQQQDLARMDQFQLGVTDRLLNTWLQTFGAVAGAGQVQGGQSSGKSKSFEFGTSMSGSYGGGGMGGG